MSDLVSLKITIKDDANYLLFGDRICRNVKELDAFCKNRYQNLQKNVEEFRYFWIDDDGDEIRVTTDEDYRSFLQAMANTKARLYVSEKKATGNQEEAVTVQAEADDDAAPVQNDATGAVESSRPVHQHVICDVCDEEIVGHRYKCLTCHDYDLCMSCEAKFRHKDHLMLRIPKPAMVCRSQTTVSRMFDKLRMYSGRITSNLEKDVAVPEPEVSGGPGNEGITDANGMKRAYARGGHRSKHSEERRTNTEPSKPSRSGKTSGVADRKQNCVAADTVSGERCTKETKEKPSTSLPTVSEMTKRCRDVMFMYLNSTEALDPSGKPVPWSTTDHVAVANVAAATATAAAARAAAVASKVMQQTSNAANGGSMATPLVEPTPQELEQMLKHANATNRPKKITSPATTASPATPPTMPIPFLPFVNLPWSQEKLMVASENISKLLDPLGLSFELRHKLAGTPSTPPGGSPNARGENAGAPVPSTSSATVAEAASLLPTSLAQEETKEPLYKKQEQPIQTMEPVQLTVEASVSEPSNTAQKSKESAETEVTISGEKDQQTKPASGNKMLESDSVGVDKAEVAVENEADDTDDSQTNSSASLLTDDDQDLLEVNEEGKENSSPSTSKPSKKPAEKSWTLIDIPHEHDEVKVDANVPLDAIAKLIAHDISSSTDKEEPAQPPKPLLPSKEKKKDKPLYPTEELKKHRKAMADEREANRAAALNQVLSVLAPPTTLPTNSDPAPSTSSAASSSSIAAGRSGKSSHKSSSPQKDSTIYSRRPHVNHAIHTMMTMGFSNHNGWLTQLLESLNGDIPKALDLLLQHRH